MCRTTQMLTNLCHRGQTLSNFGAGYFLNKWLSWTFYFRHFGDHSVKITHVLKAKKIKSNVAQTASIKYNRKRKKNKLSSIFRKCWDILEYKWLKAARLQYKSTCRAYLARPSIKAVHEAKVSKYTKSLLRVQYHGWGFKASKLRRKEKKALMTSS